MAYDPVFDRQMFQPKAPKSKGIVALADDSGETSDLDLRRQKAMEMLAQARYEQDPANFQTLSDRERPMVFRPTAVNLPQQPQQLPVQQQMAQMQAAGLHPVGMAHGGIAHFVEGGLNTISPTTAPAGEDSSKNNSISMKPPATWSDEDIDSLAHDIYNSNLGSYESSTAKSDIGRGIQSLNPFRSKPDLNLIIQDLKTKRDIATRYREENAGHAALLEAEDKRFKAVEDNPVPSIFSSTAPGQSAKAQDAQTAALSEIDNAEAERIKKAGGTGIGQGMAQTEGGSGNYMSRVPATPLVGIKTVEPVVSPPNKDAPDKDHPTNLKDIKNEKADNFNLALIRAGLGMAAGKSSNPLTNIAEGGIQGIEQYATQAGRDRAANLEQQKLDVTKQHYDTMEKIASNRYAAMQANQEKLAYAAKVKAVDSATKALQKWKDDVSPTGGKLATPEQIDAKKQQLFKEYYVIHSAELSSGLGSNPAGLDLPEE